MSAFGNKASSTAALQRAAQCIRPEVRALKPYHVPAAADMIKLDAMENPYSWPPRMVDEWLAALRAVELNRYPDAEAHELRERLRNAMGAPAELDLLLGNGSDELIQLIIMAAAAPGRKILVPSPTFSMYHMIATFVGVECVAVPLRGDDFSLDMEAMTCALDAHDPAVVFLAYPNNPTGNLFAVEDMLAIVQRAPGLVVIDEAYHAFAQASFMDKLAQFDNLIVLRTLSKLGLAGLRVGVAIGAPAWLEEINKIRLPYNLNTLSQFTAAFALDHASVFAEQTAAIRRDRTWLAERLASLRGIRVYDSRANFILFKVPQGTASHVFEQLKDRRVLIKNLHGSHPQLDSALRVTVGKPEENQAFIDALMAVM